MLRHWKGLTAFLREVNAPWTIIYALPLAAQILITASLVFPQLSNQ